MKGVVDDLYGHVHRVADLAIAIGKEMSLDPANVKRLSLVGILHDVGKIHIDPAVLAKPGPLDDMERDHMRRHPEIGYAMIAQKFDRRVAEAILYHHERWDGEGYPHRLRGERIPLEARVLGVADVFDAMTSFRPYRPALSIEQALGELERFAGTQFDPTLAELFVDGWRRGSIAA